MEKINIGNYLCVDFCIRQENLCEDLNELLQLLAINQQVHEHELPKIGDQFRRGKKNYRAYYDESSKAIITNSFRREIDINSYRF